MFEPRLDKYEEWIERQIVETAEEIVCDYFSVNSIYELTQDQIQEVLAYRKAMSDDALLAYGFTEVIYIWQNEHDVEIV